MTGPCLSAAGSVLESLYTFRPQCSLVGPFFRNLPDVLQFEDVKKNLNRDCSEDFEIFKGKKQFPRIWVTAEGMVFERKVLRPVGWRRRCVPHGVSWFRCSVAYSTSYAPCGCSE